VGIPRACASKSSEISQNEIGGGQLLTDRPPMPNIRLQDSETAAQSHDVLFRA
jgi:hypothetical protein